jgi:hypothetical protein
MRPRRSCAGSWSASRRWCASAVARAIRHTYREAGWLDEDRSVFVTDLFEVEPAKTEHERGMHSDVVTVCR